MLISRLLTVSSWSVWVVGMVSRSRERPKQQKNLSFWEGFLLGRDDETRDIYSRAVGQFCEVNGFKTLEEAAEKMDEHHFINYIKSLKDKGLATNSLRLYATAVRRFYEACERPLNQMRVRMLLPKRRQTRETNAFPKKLMRDFLFYCPRERRLLFHLLFATGLRIGEALSLRKKDFNLQSDPPKISLVREKSSKQGIVFIPPDLKKKLEQHLSTLRDDDFVFHVRDNPQKPLKRDKVGEQFRRILLKIDELKRDRSGRGYTYTLHSFRRTYETILASSGVHPMVVKYLVGHTQGTEDSYLRLSEADLAREWKKAEQSLRLDIPGWGELPIEHIQTLARSQLMIIKMLKDLPTIKFESARGLEELLSEDDREKITQYIRELEKFLPSVLGESDEEQS